MSDKLWPRLSDIRFSHEAVGDFRQRLLSDSAHRALMNLVGCCAAGLVWTYSEPGDGSLPDDDEMLARLAGFKLRRWKVIRKEIEHYFKIKRGRWHFDRDWISVGDNNARCAVPTEVRKTVLKRQGKVCTYCGDTDGPFDFDHIMPVSRGGTNAASNLTLACFRCNRSKGALTLAEWIDRRMRGECP